MRAAFGIVLVFASWGAAQANNPTTRPSNGKPVATRPAVATTRPARANAVLSTERLQEYRAALAKLKLEKNPKIQTIRHELQERKESGLIKYQKEQAQNSDKAAIAARKGNIRARRRQPIRALNQAGKLRDAQRDAQTAAARLNENQDDYARAMGELNRLEQAWTLVREYGVHLEFQQWYHADAARGRLDTLLAKSTSNSYPPELGKRVEPIENSIREDLRKIDER